MMKKLHPLLFLSNANCIGGKLIEQSGAPYLWSYFVQKKWESEKKRIAHFCHSQVKLNTLINPAWNWKKWTIQFLLIIYWLKYLRCLLSSISHNIFHVISSYINFLINITLHCYSLFNKIFSLGKVISRQKILMTTLPKLHLSGISCTEEKNIILSCQPCSWILCASLVCLSFMQLFRQ